MARFVVHCRVSGGITGTRESNLRDENGTCYFDTFELAEAEAQRQRASISPYSHATFTYQAQEA